MSKLITLAILVVSVTLVSTSWSQKSRTTNTNTEAAAQEMEVTILFSGLMVLNKKSDDGDFEMGILSDADVQKEHEFCVRQASSSKVICRKEMGEMGTRT